MTEIKDGVRYRVTFEGVGDNGLIRTDTDNFVGSGGATSVQVIEPEYEVGAVYQDAQGILFYRRDKHAWVWPHTGQVFGNNRPMRPLRKLVP